MAIEQYAGADVKDFNAQLINIAAKKPEVLFCPTRWVSFPFRYSRPVRWNYSFVPGRRFLGFEYAGGGSRRRYGGRRLLCGSVQQFGQQRGGSVLG